MEPPSVQVLIRIADLGLHCLLSYISPNIKSTYSSIHETTSLPLLKCFRSSPIFAVCVRATLTESEFEIKLGVGIIECAPEAFSIV